MERFSRKFDGSAISIRLSSIDLIEPSTNNGSVLTLRSGETVEIRESFDQVDRLARVA